MRTAAKILLALTSIATWSCVRGENAASKNAPKPGVANDDTVIEPAAPSTDVTGAPLKVNAVAGNDGSFRANLVANPTTAQQVAIDQPGKLAGLTMTLPAGALAVETEISLAEAAALGDAATLGDLGIAADAILGAGTSVSIVSSTSQDLALPGSLSIQLPDAGPALGLNDEYGNLVVLYRVLSAATGTEIVGLIPRAEIAIAGNFAVFSFKSFGVFQAVFLRDGPTARIETPASAPATPPSSPAPTSPLWPASPPGPETPPPNDAPVAQAVGFNGTEDVPLTITAPGLLAYATDANGDALTAAVVTGVGSGLLTLDPAGHFTYTPAANFNGQDAFTYRVFDGETYSEAATVTLTIASVDDLPVATVDAYTLQEDAELVVDTTLGLLANDSDVDDALMAQIVSPPSHALTFVPQTNGSFTYRPVANFNGSDTFTYRPLGGSGSPADVTVTLTVEAVDDAPVAVADDYPVLEDQVLAVPGGSGLLANDTDAEGHARTIVIDAGPTHAASFAYGTDGSFDYTPALDYVGNDSFTYHTVANGVSSGIVTVTIPVTAVNDAPVFGAIGNRSGPEDAPITNIAFVVDEGGGADEDGQSLMITATSSNPSLVKEESIAINYEADLGTDATGGSLSITPESGQTGTATITVSAADGLGGIGTKQFTVTFDGTPQFGTGADGDLNIVFDTNAADAIGARRISANRRIKSVAGSVVTLTSPFTPQDFVLGDEIFWIILAADSAAAGCVEQIGAYGFANVTATDGASSTISLSTTLGMVANDLPPSEAGFCLVQISRVPQFDDVTIAGAALRPDLFNIDAGTGGVLAMRVNGTLTSSVSGKIDAQGRGFPGGSAGAARLRGAGVFGGFAIDPTGFAYGSGGGGGGGFVGGGGGSNFGAGGNGATNLLAVGVGAASLSILCSGPCNVDQRIAMGGGGGNGQHAGGRGGGILLVFANEVVGDPLIIDARGTDAVASAGMNAGGGGAGGTALVEFGTAADSLNVLFDVSGGAGGAPEMGTGAGGGGGGGGVVRSKGGCPQSLSFQAGGGNFGASVTLTVATAGGVGYIIDDGDCL